MWGPSGLGMPASIRQLMRRGGVSPVGVGVSHLTDDAIQGTTLGILKVEAVVTSLTREEEKVVHISKEMRPRPY